MPVNDLLRFSGRRSHKIIRSGTLTTIPNSASVVNTGYDGAGRTAWVQGSRNGAVVNYVGNPSDTNTWVHYWPHGAVYYYTAANSVTHAVSYNKRLQPTESYDAVNNDAGHMLYVGCANWGDPSNAGVYGLCPHPAWTPDNGTLQVFTEYHGGPGYSSFLSFQQTYGMTI